MVSARQRENQKPYRGCKFMAQAGDSEIAKKGGLSAAQPSGERRRMKITYFAFAAFDLTFFADAPAGAARAAA